MTRARLLVIQHEDEAPLGWFDGWFASAGAACDVVAAHRGEAVPESLDGYAGLVVLGGEMGAYDDAAYPWLVATKTLIARAVLPDGDVSSREAAGSRQDAPSRGAAESAAASSSDLSEPHPAIAGPRSDKSGVGAGRPFLGICLGHQLAAVALGGEVSVNPHGHATGLTPVGVTAAGQDDVLLGSVDAGAPTVMWNHDVVTGLPDGAVALAMSPDGTIQAARFAPLAWGVQFHPEASPDIFDGWTIDKPAVPVLPGIDIAAAAARIRAAEHDLQRTWEPVARRFAALAAPHRDYTSSRRDTSPSLDLSEPQPAIAGPRSDKSRVWA